MTMKKDEPEKNVSFIGAIRDRLIELEARDATNAFFERDEIDIEFEQIVTERSDLDNVDFLHEEVSATSSTHVNPSVGRRTKGLLSRLPSLESIFGTYFEASGEVFADSGTGEAKKERASDRVWMQDELLLTLRSSGKNRLEVFLDIEGTFENDPVFLSWIDDGSLDEENTEEVSIVRYPIFCQPNGSYSVEVPSRAYVKRMRLIDAIDDGRISEGIELSVLLPFVEFSERV